jgi:hypothetical protein
MFNNERDKKKRELSESMASVIAQEKKERD